MVDCCALRIDPVRNHPIIRQSAEENMRTILFRKIVLLVVFLAGSAAAGNAAVVGAAGYTNGFATNQLATDWSTLNVAGRVGDLLTSADRKSTRLNSSHG